MNRTGKTKASHGNSRVQYELQQPIEQEQVASQIDGHSVQQASNESILTYKLMPTDKISETDLKERIAKADKINKNPDFVTSKWQEACAKTKNSPLKETGPLFIKETMQEIADCGIFTCPIGGNHYVFPIEFLPKKGNVIDASHLPSALKILQSVEKNLPIDENSIPALIDEGFLKEGSAITIEDYDFVNQRAITETAKPLRASNWFDARLFLKYSDAINTLLECLRRTIRVSKLKESQQKTIEEYNRFDIKPITAITDAEIEKIDWDNFDVSSL